MGFHQSVAQQTKNPAGVGLNHADRSDGLRYLDRPQRPAASIEPHVLLMLWRLVCGFGAFNAVGVARPSLGDVAPLALLAREVTLEAAVAGFMPGYDLEHGAILLHLAKPPQHERT